MHKLKHNENSKKLILWVSLVLILCMISAIKAVDNIIYCGMNIKKYLVTISEAEFFMFEYIVTIDNMKNIMKMAECSGLICMFLSLFFMKIIVNDDKNRINGNLFPVIRYKILKMILRFAFSPQYDDVS